MLSAKNGVINQQTVSDVILQTPTYKNRVLVSGGAVLIVPAHTPDLRFKDTHLSFCKDKQVIKKINNLTDKEKRLNSNKMCLFFQA